jgi:hypothetical protein
MESYPLILEIGIALTGLLLITLDKFLEKKTK